MTCSCQQPSFLSHILSPLGPLQGAHVQGSPHMTWAPQLGTPLQALTFKSWAAKLHARNLGTNPFPAAPPPQRPLHLSRLGLEDKGPGPALTMLFNTAWHPAIGQGPHIPNSPKQLHPPPRPCLLEFPAAQLASLLPLSSPAPPPPSSETTPRCPLLQPSPGAHHQRETLSQPEIPNSFRTLKALSSEPPASLLAHFFPVPGSPFTPCTPFQGSRPSQPDSDPRAPAPGPKPRPRRAGPGAPPPPHLRPRHLREEVERGGPLGPVRVAAARALALDAGGGLLARLGLGRSRSRPPRHALLVVVLVVLGAGGVPRRVNQVHLKHFGLQPAPRAAATARRQQPGTRGLHGAEGAASGGGAWRAGPRWPSTAHRRASPFPPSARGDRGNSAGAAEDSPCAHPQRGSRDRPLPPPAGALDGPQRSCPTSPLPTPCTLPFPWQRPVTSPGL